MLQNLPFFIPIIGYITAGLIKFIINSIKSGKISFDKIGMGNFPSTHNTITSSTYFTIVFIDGIDSLLAIVGLTILIIVAIDSLDLRNQIESHARILINNFGDKVKIREKIGHEFYEVIGGIILGLVIAYFVYEISIFKI